MSNPYVGEGMSARLAPGTRLNGIFEIDRHIASGGMGEIYRGHTVETGDPVAIKVMRTDLADNAMALALFRKEASALYNINHEAIVRYYIFSSDPGTQRLYLAMEYIDGQPLSEILKQGPLGLAAISPLQQRLAAGLHAAHRYGIIHRDLSPDNVLIPDGDVARAKIIDFGIARSTRAGDGTIIGSGFAGKYNYVSPEQLGLFGGEISAKSDIYSLGLVLAQCILGHPIDMGGSQVEVIEKRRVVPDLAGIDAQFRPLLTRMLQPDPRERPESMAVVAAWGAATAPHPAPPAASRGRPAAKAGVVPGRPPKSGSGRWLVAAGIALVLMFGAGSIGLYLLPGSLFRDGFDQSPVGPRLQPPALSPDPAVDPLREADERRAAEQAEALARQRAEAEARRSEEEARRRADEDTGKRVEAEPPPTDPRARIDQFIARYDGGDCFFVTPVATADGRATLDGFGSAVAPFEALDNEFKRQNGFEASIGLHQVTAAQCPAVSFLWRLRNQRGPIPGLDIGTVLLRSGGALTGAVTNFGGRDVALVLVADDGRVHNLSAMLKPSGETRVFNIRMQKTEPGPAQPQLLFAIVASKPLDALKSAQLGSADEVFPQMLTELLQAGQPVGVAAKYFKLEK